MKTRDPLTALIVNEHEGQRGLPLYSQDNGGVYIWGKQLAPHDVLVTDEAVRTVILRRSRLAMANKHLAILQSTTELYTSTLASLDALLNEVAAEHVSTNDMGTAIPQEFWDTLGDTCRRMQDAIRTSDDEDSRRDALLTAEPENEVPPTHFNPGRRPHTSPCGLRLTDGQGTTTTRNDHRLGHITCPVCLKACTDPSRDADIHLWTTLGEQPGAVTLADLVAANEPNTIADVVLWARTAMKGDSRWFGGGAAPLFAIEVR